MKIIVLMKQVANKDAILRIRLLIEPNAAELQELHWETLRDPERDEPGPQLVEPARAFHRSRTRPGGAGYMRIARTSRCKTWLFPGPKPGVTAPEEIEP